MDNKRYYEVYDDIDDEVIDETDTRYETVNKLLRDVDLTHYKVVVKETFFESDGKKYLITLVDVLDDDEEKIRSYKIDCVKIYHGEVVGCPYDEEIEMGEIK